MLKTYEITLDIEKELYSVSDLLFSISRNDFDSVELQFKIKQDESNFNLTDKTVELAIKKPSGLTVYQTCEITNAVEGEAKVRLSIQAYIEYGIHVAEIYIRDADQLAVTSPFWYSARTAIMENEATDSINEWSALQQALFAYDLKPIITEGFPTELPEYVGQLAFDAVNKAVFIASDLTVESWQVLGTGEGGSSVVSWDYIIDKPVAFTPEIHTHDYIDIKNKPILFPAEAHDHAIADVVALQEVLDGKAAADHNHDSAYSPINHNHDLEYAPIDHDHNSVDISDFTTAVDTRIDTALSAYTPTIPAEYLTETEADLRYAPIDTVDSEPLQVVAAPTTTPEFIGQTAIDTVNKRTYIAEGTTAADWRRLAGTNYVDTADAYITNTVLAGLKLWKGTQAAYELLTKDPNTLYFIIG